MVKAKIEKCVDLLFDLVEIVCRLLLIFMICTVTAQVFVRMFHSNIKWCEEVMLLGLDALMFLLLPVGVKYDLHIRVEIFAIRLPRTARIALVYLSNAVLAVIAVTMIYYGYFLMQTTNSFMTITGIPRKYLYLVTVISGILTLIVVLAKFFGMSKTQSTVDFINGINTEYDEAAKQVQRGNEEGTQG